MRFLPKWKKPKEPLSPLDRMVAEQIEPRGVRDPRVLDALRRVDRAAFLPESARSEAYEDKAVPTLLGQTISQPYIVAAMTALLAPGAGDRVLEIGTGTGYQAAILSLLVREVHTVERHRALADAARARLAAMGMANVFVHCADGTMGWPAAAPYSRIIVTAGARDLPPALAGQLADGGILVAPIAAPSPEEGDAPGEVLCRWTRRGAGLHREDFFPVRFVPLLPGLPEARP